MKPSTSTRTSPAQTVWGFVLAACLSFSWVYSGVSQAQPTTSERLTIQSGIDHHVFLNEAIFPWAHNAYNSDSSEAGYGYIFPNQSETITTMLDAGLRLIDLDLVWANFEVRMCHGGVGACAGGEVTFETRLKEIKDWFDADPSRYETEVVIVHVESKIYDDLATWADMSDFSGCHYHIAVDDIRDSGIDDLVYKPTSTCTDFADLAAGITKADVLSAGKNVIFIGADDVSCGYQCMEVFGETDKWGHWVFNKLPEANLVDHESFSGFPNCSGGGFAGHNAFTVAYNDIVGVFQTEYMTGPEMERLVGCGVNGISHEKFVEDNSYHRDHVWSWGTDEPRGMFDHMDCALLSNDGDMKDANCTTTSTHRFACQNLETGGWVPSAGYRTWIEGQQACYDEFGLDSVFSVPANGYQSNLITSTLANPSTVWVNYSDALNEGDWKPMAAATEVVFDLEAGNADGTLRRTTTIPMASDAAPAMDRFGTHGGALEFSQSHDTLAKGLLEQEFGANATLSIWFKGNAGAQVPEVSRLAVFSESGWSLNTGILIKPDGTLAARCQDEADNTRRGRTSSTDLVAGYTGPTQFWDGQWHHAAYVNDGSTSKLYVDGELMSSTNDACADLVDSLFITIGSSLKYRGYAFDGVLDDLRIYGAALSAADIAEMAGGPRTPAVGGDGGNFFRFVVDDDGGEVVEKVRIRSGTRLDAIRIETNTRDSGWFGGSGGNEYSLTLGSGEFINKVTVCEDYTGLHNNDTVHYVEFETNLNRSLVGGRYRGTCSVLINGHRFLGIHGASGGEVDRLGIYYGTPTIQARHNAAICLVKEDDNWHNGNDLVLGNCDAATDAFKGWWFEASTGYIRSSENPSKCLHKQYGNWNNGNPIHVWDCNQGSSGNKTWDYDPSTGYIKARQNNSMCMHKKYSGWGVGNPIHLWNCSAGPAANKSWDLF